MGYKAVCFNCKKSFSRPHSAFGHVPTKCLDCGGTIALLNQTFRPPKKNDKEAWEVVKYLFENGFTYQHIHNESLSPGYVQYPTNMRDAKEFVSKYKKF
jgi:hypothetical protein